MNVVVDDSLRFWVRPEEGPPYQVDLVEFAKGGRVEDFVDRCHTHWKGDYQGRQGFAFEIAKYFRDVRPPEREYARIKSDLRNLFRFLDEIDPRATVLSCLQLEDGHGFLLQRWAEAKGRSGASYAKIKLLVAAIRDVHDAPRLFWPARSRDSMSVMEDIDEVGVHKLFQAFKAEAVEIKAMFREGDSLADAGEDPRGALRQPGSAKWERRENHAWLIREMTRDRLLSKEEFFQEGCSRLSISRPEIRHTGPAYLVPGMTQRGEQGIVGKLRWFHPSYHDTAIFLWLFLLGTGWNLATALSLDVSADENWCEDHPQQPKFKVLHAFKNRVDQHQFAFSLEKRQWHPYQIVKFMIERTASLRRTIQHSLVRARAEGGDNPTPAQRAVIERLETIQRSPWLYHVVNKAGEVNRLEGADSRHLNNLARAIVVKHKLDEAHPSLVQMCTGDARDAWIGHAYFASGHNILIARLAAQHSDFRSLRHYLRRRRYRAASEAAIRRVQDAAFSEIKAGRKLDPTRLRLLVANGEISPEQERRLLDLRQRTRMGMGCLEPRRPPSNIAPDHVDGALCRVQRCTGCVHGVVFEESLPFLARARAELIFLKRNMPLATWGGTSFEQEEISLDATLGEFDAVNVTAMVDNWLKKFISGEVVPHDTYPSY